MGILDGTAMGGRLASIDALALVYEASWIVQLVLVLLVLLSVFSWAIKNDISGIETNPCHGISRNPTQPRERVLSERELPLVWRALDHVGLVQGRLTAATAAL